MNSRLPAALIVVGVAILSLTPASPPALRSIDLLAAHAYRPLAAGCERILAAYASGPAAPSSLATTPGTGEAAADAGVPGGDVARAALTQRDRWIAHGAEQFAPERRAAFARVVAVDLRARTLQIDAGGAVQLSRGDPVLFKDVAIGVVASCSGGMGVVTTPFSPGARFPAEVAGAPPVRFVLDGQNRPEWLAAVLHPDRARSLATGAEARVPDAAALFGAPAGEPIDFAPVLPAGLVLGVLDEDELLARTGTAAFCVRPQVALAGLDAVVVLPAAAPAPAPGAPGESGALDDGFERRAVARLPAASASPWRDGETLAGAGVDGLPVGAAVTAGGAWIGTVDAALLGVARVRGLFDPGREVFLLAAGPAGSRMLQVVAVRRDVAGGRLRARHGAPPPQPGDVLFSAGRGMHVPRGLFVGRVTRADGDAFDVARPLASPHGTVTALVRRGAPESPWEP